MSFNSSLQGVKTADNNSDHMKHQETIVENFYKLAKPTLLHSRLFAIISFSHRCVIGTTISINVGPIGYQY